MRELCFDISTWQGGIDYQAIKDRTNYCIIRAGYGDFGDGIKDNQFENHYANLQGLNLGAYWYSDARDEEQAKSEARKFLEYVGDKKFTLPLYLDIEDSSQRGVGREELDKIVIAFGEVIIDAGYYFGVYTNVDWYENVISGRELNNKYDWWIASFGINDGEPHRQPTGIDYGIWQYTSKYNTFGEDLDANFMYKDYPTIIRDAGLNHLGSNFKYRAHVEDYGWQNWKHDGQPAGTTGSSKRLEALQIDAPFEVKAKAHIQNIGWVDYGIINKDTIIGTTGESKRLEDLCFKGNFKYRVHIQGTGWTPWTNADGIATLGTVGQSLRIECIEIKPL